MSGINCKVCENKMGEEGICPVCKFMNVGVAGDMDYEMQKAFEDSAAKHKEKIMKGIGIYIRGYHWEEENGQLVEKFHEDFLIADNLHNMQMNQVSWGRTSFAKQSAGEPLKITVVVKNAKGPRNYSVNVKAPDTEDMWRVGFVLKPCLKFVVRIGDEFAYSDSSEISLKG